jgi:hypothetical protein
VTGGWITQADRSRWQQRAAAELAAILAAHPDIPLLAWTVTASGGSLSGQVLAPAASRRGLFGQWQRALGLDEATETPSRTGTPVYLHARGVRSGVAVSVSAARLLLAGLGPQDATAPHWVAMGPASITVLAAAQILRITGAPAVNAVITGLAVIFRALASCLIPPLIARSTWRHLHRNAPLRYRSDLWMIVFPADMYATAGMQFGTAAGLPLIQRIGTAAAWPAAAAWALTFAAMIASPCTRPPNWVPTTWNAVSPEGPASSTQMRIRWPAWTCSGENRFLAIVSSAVLAVYLNRSPVTRPDGFVLETSAAGGHSAPAAGPDAAQPCWRAGVWPTGPHRHSEGRQHRAPVLARGRSRDTAGAGRGARRGCCGDPGRDGVRAVPGIRPRSGTAQAAAGTGRRWGALRCANDPRASPAGFPFKVAQLRGTLSEEETYQGRSRLCDLGYLRTPHRRANGAVGYRCPAEPVDAYVRKGGSAGDTAGRRCLCNALTAGPGPAPARRVRRATPPHPRPGLRLPARPAAGTVRWATPATRGWPGRYGAKRSPLPSCLR